jgi:hypothetical protein
MKYPVQRMKLTSSKAILQVLFSNSFSSALLSFASFLRPLSVAGALKIKKRLFKKRLLKKRVEEGVSLV